MKILFRKKMTGREALAKRAELELRYGLKLTCYSTGDGWNFRPYIHDGIVPNDNPEMCQKVLSVIPLSQTGYSFTYIAEKCGMTVRDTLSVCAFLVKARKVAGDISRDGKIVGVHNMLLNIL